MGFTEIMAMIGLLMTVITKAIPFIEEIMNGAPGADKKAAVTAIAKIAVSGIAAPIVANNPKWDFLAPMASAFIDNAVTAVNAVQAAQGTASPAPGHEV